MDEIGILGCNDEQRVFRLSSAHYDVPAHVRRAAPRREG
jgi:hypothetical protein